MLILIGWRFSFSTEDYIQYTSTQVFHVFQKRYMNLYFIHNKSSYNIGTVQYKYICHDNCTSVIDLNSDTFTGKDIF